jgi:hypothetical protein
MPPLGVTDEAWANAGQASQSSGSALCLEGLDELLGEKQSRQ